MQLFYLFIINNTFIFLFVTTFVFFFSKIYIERVEMTNRSGYSWCREDLSAKQVIALYALRMQIEETFRDTKNIRFGWSFRHARCKS
jgi:hypothetical protein